MAVNIDHSDDDSDFLPEEAENDEGQPKLSGREANQHILDMRRKIEDRLERRRLKDELGCDDLWELDA
ncbi:PA3496 family putative envelope integrity protein [Marinimicrobium sp. ARAG 43.8]|uniref:PA3496 family putative envelope integrity protein n=1 Tax=Marinimicrobium sp. ARAG 43.8 TaxID=3418719 RepID=UPI003CF9129F